MFGGDARQRLAQLAEPARPVEQRVDDEQRPAVADAIEGGLEGGRAGVRRVRGLVHAADPTRSPCIGSESVVCCDLQLTTDTEPRNRHAIVGRTRHRRHPATMSALDELSSAIRAVHDVAGSAVVGIGRGIRGSGVVIGDGRVLTNAHNLRGDEVTVTFRDGRIDPRHRARRRPRRRPRGRRRSTRPGRHAVAWSDAEPGRRRRRLRPRRDGRRTGSGDGRLRLGDRADVPGPGRLADRRQPRAHRAAGPGLVGRAARRRRGPAPRAQHEPRSARASTWPVPPTPRCASGSTPSVAANPSSRPRLGIAVAPSHVARRLRALGRPERSGRPARPRRRGRQPRRSGRDPRGRPARRGRRHGPRRTRTRCPRSSPRAGLPIELKIVRGDEERSVSVGGTTDASGEA